MFANQPLGLLLIDYTILGLALLFALFGLGLIVRGWFARRGAAFYNVGKLRRRSEAATRMVQGGGVLLAGIMLLVVWAVLPRPPAAAEVVTPTPGLSATPTTAAADPTATTTMPTAAPTATAEAPEPTATVALTVSAPTTPSQTLTPTTALPALATAEPTPLPTDPPPPTATPIPFDAFVNVVGGLNLRDAPNGETILLLENGSGVFLLAGSENDGVYTWRQVRTLDGSEGWVADEFLIIVEQ